MPVEVGEESGILRDVHDHTIRVIDTAVDVWDGGRSVDSVVPRAAVGVVRVGRVHVQVAGVPALDVVECGCLDRGGIGGALGVLEAMYAHAVTLLPGREAVLFINAANTRSLKAHAKLGMVQVASFTLGEQAFIVLSSRNQDIVGN